ncbi:MAG: hypothetical protein C5B56_05410 [Proteobacteria bacterium]|nr:MAG: hypothetical protein C5B56_05410 [Pseudomonadota bacterium]
MKKLFAAVALAAVVSSPALAQYGTQYDRTERAQQYDRATHGSANQDWRTLRRHSPNPAYDVYDNEGFYVGSDPDPLVRDALRRDHNGRGY